ncbi:MAG: efflux RND transporter periplasmic adaptor subunit [Chthoniobacterales bacterium]
MKNSRNILVLLGVAGIAIALFFATRSSKSEASSGTSHSGRHGDDANRPIAVVIGTVEKKDFPVFDEGIGTVQAFNSVVVRARIDGELQKVLFTEGQDVKKDDLLAVIDPRPFQAQLDQMIAKQAQDEAQLNNAKVTLARDTSLMGKSVIDQQTYDTQKYLVDQLAATVKGDQAAVSNAQTQLSYTQITAPISGRVGIRQVDEGNMIRATDTTGLLTITQLQPITVVFTLPEQNLSEVQKNSTSAPLKVYAFERDNTHPMGEGVVAVIDNQIDQTTGTIKLKATFPNNDLRLWPGQFVNARLLVKILKDSLVVPVSAVQRGPDGTFAYIVDKNNTAELRKIKVGPSENNMALIEEGLAANERIVVDGQYKLQPGSKIEEIPQLGAATNRTLGSTNEQSSKVSVSKDVRKTKS